MSNTPRVTRPVLRYHGGKHRDAPWIVAHFPPHRVYVEPFGGAASVLMRKERSYAEIYNDLDAEVCNLFRVLREDEQAERLRLAIEMTPFARDEYRLSYDVAPDPVEQARRTLVRSFMGFGSNSLNRQIKSGFRANSNRSGTTPARDWRNLPAHVPHWVERLRGVVIENKDAAYIMAKHDGLDTLHYADPPYPYATRTAQISAHGHHGYAHEMSDDDHRMLATMLTWFEGYGRAEWLRLRSL